MDKHQPPFSSPFEEHRQTSLDDDGDDDKRSISLSSPMKNDATEAALGLLSLSPENSVYTTVPLKRAAPDDEPAYSSDSINCICGFGYDDGFSIACDDCSRWCHAACFDIVEGGVPEEWRCWVCVPRPVNRERAIRLQKDRQRQALQVATEKRRRQVSPGVERKQRRSALAIEGGNTKRKRRASVNVQPSPAEDEHVDIDEPWTHSYVPITKDVVPHQETRDNLRRQAQHWRGVSALSQPPSPFDISPVSLSLVPDSPQTTLHPLPSSSFSHPVLSSNTNPSVRPPSYAVHTTHPIQSSKFITPFTSTIIPSSAYLSDPLNAYAHHGMPKPFVHLFGPPLDVALDARVTGNDARFVRSGCRPNAVLRPVICPNSKEGRAQTNDGASGADALTFGVFALRDLKANEEVVLGWEWDDGNAVHNLPALIETPHLFPPHQIHHLRHQMTSMLHALSSTFTTCACGAKAKDCALNLMAAFVDGQLPVTPTASSPSASDANHTDGEHGSKKVDLGPLIGVQRGFRAREKSPLDGGMNGVEMVSAGPSVLSDRRNMVDTLPTSQSSNKFQRAQGGLTLPELRLSSATASPSPRKDRKGKGKANVAGGGEGGATMSSRKSGHDVSSTSPNRRRRRVTIDTTPYRSPSPSESSIAVDSDEEEKMPPKMRKRWIHRSTEALRAPSVSASPSGSMVSLGSVLGIGDADDMEIDHVPLGARDMPPPPPPPPATTDPTTLTPIPSPPSASPRIATHNLPTVAPLPPHASQSPSTPFANLSLLSPYAPSGPSPHFFKDASLSPKLSPSLVPPLTRILPTVSNDQKHPDVSESSTTMEVDQDMTDVDPDSSLETAISSTQPTSEQSNLDSPPPPPSPESPLHLDLALHESQADCLSDSPPPKHMSPPPALSMEPPQPVDNDPTDPPPCDPPPLPPPAPKVKLSLKDFTMRKKKQREEEMARVAPASLDVPLETVVLDFVGPAPAPAMNGDQAGTEGQHDDTTAPDATTAPNVTDGDHPVGEVEGRPPDALLSRPAPPAPSPTDPELEPVLHGTDQKDEPHLTNGFQEDFVSSEPMTMESSEAEPWISLKAKQELVDGPLPAVGDDVPCDVQSTQTPSPPPPENLENASRGPTQEDGEIVANQEPSRQPPPPPRSHTPPTQPRSFSNSSSSSAVSPSPSPQVHRLPASSTYRTGGSYAAASFVPPPSRPLPSGPRALRAGMSFASPGASFAAARPFSGGPYIPRGPSADRDRKDWDRERGWAGIPRGRGRGAGSSWGR